MNTIKNLLIDVVLKNGLLLILPPLIISLGFWPFLPKEFGSDAFDVGIPKWLLMCENILRILVFFSPIILINSLTNKTGWILYGSGILLYTLSYLVQMFFSQTAFANSMFAFTAPAWTTLIWFTGIALLCDTSYLPLKNSSAVYVGLSVIFTVVHVTHTVLVFLQNRKSI